MVEHDLDALQMNNMRKILQIAAWTKMRFRRGFIENTGHLLIASVYIFYGR